MPGNKPAVMRHRLAAAAADQAPLGLCQGFAGRFLPADAPGSGPGGAWLLLPRIRLR